MNNMEIPVSDYEEIRTALYDAAHLAKRENDMQAYKNRMRILASLATQRSALKIIANAFNKIESGTNYMVEN